MEGIYFYWISWIAWVYSTFLMKKNMERLLLSISLLIFIILSPYTFQLGVVSIHLVLIIILIMSYGLVGKKTVRQKVYLLICSLTITIAYVTFQLYELFDPIWLFMDREWLLTIVLVYLTLILVKGSRSRLACLLIGSCQGELFYGLILSKFRFQYEIGAFPFLDVISLSVLVVFVWLKLEVFVAHLDEMVQKNTKGETRINE